MTADVVSLLAQLGQFGGTGIIVAYLIWDKSAERKDRREQAERRAVIDERDIAAREKLATSLTALAMIIQGRPNV